MSRVVVWCLVLATGLATPALARDYKTVVDGEAIYFDLDRSEIAVGFSESMNTADRNNLLASLPAVGSPLIRRFEAPQQMAVVNLKNGTTEEELLATLAALESLDGIDWTAPVLIYDHEQHIPQPELYVQFDKTLSKANAEIILNKYGISLIKWCDDWADNVAYVKRPKGTGIESLDLCETLRGESGVVWAEPDFIRTARFSTNDTFYGSQWYLNQASDHDIDAPEAWGVTTGSTAIVISICDVGVQIAHVDLNGKIETGYDAVDGDSDPTPNTTYENDGHGTCCAGIAAAETNNSQGVAGVSYNCHLMGTRMGYIIGGNSIQTNDTWIIDCINYSRDHANVVSNSWGGGSSSSAVNTAMQNARNAGLLILFAAGNSNSSVQWPATQSSVIAVGATNESDYRCTPADWGFGQGSNYGSQLDVVAPGNNQYTVDDSRSGAGYSTGAYYTSFGGTSGACPVAAGVCALILSVNPNLTPAQVQTTLQNTADDQVGNPSEDVAGWDQYMGWGRVNAYQAVLAAGSITVTSPNGSETWYTGEAHNITWTSSGVSGNVNIDLNRSAPGGPWVSLFSNTANDGTQSWSVSGTVTSQARIRVTSVSLPSATDESDADFTIAAPFVTVSIPNGGESWITGTSHDIMWSSGGFSGNVKIELSRNDLAGPWEILATSTSNDGIQSWNVSGAGTAAARIRVSSVNVPSINDVSDANFSIVVPSIAVLAPNGGETWYVGDANSIQWQSQGVTGNVKIEINRNYSVGSWEELYAAAANDGEELWITTGPTTALARIRVTSVDQPSVLDISNGNFTIAGPPPVLFHDPLDDFAPGTGTVTAVSYSSVLLTITSVKMFYRPVGGGAFDSLQLSATANPDEYAASLAGIPVGSYEYYIKSTDNVGAFSTAPDGAPATLYTFDVADVCAEELSYDDGSAEYYSWSEGSDGVGFQWAVKFGPVLAPYVLCGARFVASRSLPDTLHSQVHVYVYAADGVGGTPGTIIQDAVTGSIGDDIGGVPTGTQWAQVNLKDDLGDALVINSSEFYIAVANDDIGKYEAFGRDTTGTNNHHSYFYDPCDDQWYSEDDTGSSDNAHPGNRLIRAQGYSLVNPPDVVIYLSGTDIVLSWNDVGAPVYNVYSAPAATGPYAFLQSTSNTTLTVDNTGGASLLKFYLVKAASE